MGTITIKPIHLVNADRVTKMLALFFEDDICLIIGIMGQERDAEVYVKNSQEGYEKIKNIENKIREAYHTATPFVDIYISREEE